MHLDTIEIAPDEAKARLDEYAGMVADERTAEDEAIVAGYRAAARGLPVVMLSQVMAAGGWFPDGLPRLAIARADTAQCVVQVSIFGSNSPHWDVSFRDERWAPLRARHVGRHGVTVPMPRPESVERHRWSGTTVVPVIPPRHRPKARHLHRYHVLWEVERWDPTPPVDPALLRHIRGDLWAVLATWDLTPLERAVLAQRG